MRPRDRSDNDRLVQQVRLSLCGFELFQQRAVFFRKALATLPGLFLAVIAAALHARARSSADAALARTDSARQQLQFLTYSPKLLPLHAYHNSNNE